MANTTDTPKIPEMVERVRNATFPIISRWAYAPSNKRRNTYEIAEETARAALLAIREPTFSMITAARRVQLEPPDEDDKGHFRQAWRNMIDAALGE